MRMLSSGYLSRHEEKVKAKMADRIYVFIFLMFIVISFLV